MQNIMIGTAGHVDHGKTCLIRALTGIETDRLAEEKKRGITIENGFAFMPDTPGMRIGIVDVPGHEKFIRNMLAGIGGIDLVLLVIALDEGVMPQTREHFHILEMLRIRRGILVFTKKDLADDDLIRMVQEETKEMVAGSFLENAPSVCVSAETGENITQLREMILAEAKNIAARQNAPELFRLPIDRVFVQNGVGTIVTGTLIKGSCAAGDTLMLYPQEKEVRIRSIQSHNQQEETALAGQRTAFNLVGIRREEMERGEVLARPGQMIPSMMLDAKVQLFSDTGHILKNNSRVHICYGSARAVCKVVLLDRDELKAGESGYVQLRFEKPAAVRKGDRFIILFYSPVESFGGGVILEADAKKHRRKKEDVLNGLSIKDTGSESEQVEEELKEYSDHFPDVREISVRLNLAEKTTEDILAQLKDRKRVIFVGRGRMIHKTYWETIAAYAEGMLRKYHASHSVIRQMEKAEFFNRMQSRFLLDSVQNEEILRELVKRKVLQASAEGVALYGIDTTPDAEIARLTEGLLERYRAAGFAVPYTEKVAAEYRNSRQIRQILSGLQKKGLLVRVDATAYMAREHWQYIVGVLYDRLEETGKITLAEYRDLLHTSRKYSQMFLEAFDQRKYTKMIDDVHVKLRDRPEDPH